MGYISERNSDRRRYWWGFLPIQPGDCSGKYRIEHRAILSYMTSTGRWTILLFVLNLGYATLYLLFLLISAVFGSIDHRSTPFQLRDHRSRIKSGRTDLSGNHGGVQGQNSSAKSPFNGYG